MTTYMSAEENNQMIKTMMLNNNCNHISGDDTNDNGYRLIIKEDDECECNVVRNLTSDDNIGIHLNNTTNSLFIYDRKETMKTLITGGGIATLTFAGGNILSLSFRFDGDIRFRPIGTTETITVNMMARRDFIRMLPWTGNRQVTDLGAQLDSNQAMYLTVDPTLMGGRSQNPNLIIGNTRNVDVINRSSDTYLLCYRNDTDPNSRFIHWVPTDTKIPFTAPGSPQTLTYNIDTGEKSWAPNAPVPEDINYSSLQTISGGGTVTYRNTGQFTWVHFNELVIISHVPSNNPNGRIIRIPMSTEDGTVININANGDRILHIARLFGFEMGTNSKALFFDASINRLILVDHGAPRSAYNPNSSWILICFITPTDRSLVWLPGRINLPFVTNGIVTYNNVTGTASWLSTPTNASAIGAQNAPPVLSIEDITKGNKVIDISCDNNKVVFDSSQLVNTLNSYASRLIKAPKQIGARINFNLTIICQWGNQKLSTKNIIKSNDGQIDIKFPAPLSNSNYGISLSMQSNKPGIIQYSNVTEKGFSLVTFDLQGKPTQFDGDFSFDIQT